jgi:uncharacterized protein
MINKPPSWEALVKSMTPDMHQSLKTAVELGKWPSGERLTPEQVEYCLQAIIAYDKLYLHPTEQVAYIDTSGLHKSQSDD